MLVNLGELTWYYNMHTANDRDKVICFYVFNIIQKKYKMLLRSPVRAKIQLRI